MTLLLKFLEFLLKYAPDLVNVVQDVVKEMFAKGELSESQREKLTRRIRATKDKEIDARIDAKVAARFPKDD